MDKCIFLVTTTREDTIRVYKIQPPRAIRERYRITPVEEGSFTMANFFTIFNDNLNEFTLKPSTTTNNSAHVSKRKKGRQGGHNNEKLKFPIFSNVSWQDCFILLEIFIMNFFFAKRNSEIRVKTVNIVPPIQSNIVNRDELATNLLSTVNINILAYYHIWYLYNHSRLDVMIHSWQTILFKQSFMRSYSILCHLASFDTILNWIYSNTKTQIRLMKITCADNGYIFGPFNCSRTSENITHARYNVCFRKFSTTPTILVDCFNVPQCTLKNRAFVSIISTKDLEEEHLDTVENNVLTNVPNMPMDLDFSLPFQIATDEDNFFLPTEDPPRIQHLSSGTTDYMYNSVYDNMYSNPYNNTNASSFNDIIFGE